MSDAFDVEAYLEQQSKVAASAENTNGVNDDKDKEKSRDKDRERDRERDRDRSRDRDRRRRSNSRDRRRKRDSRDRSRDRDRNRDRSRDRDRERDRSRDKERGRDKDKDKERDTEREERLRKEKERENSLERERRQERELQQALDREQLKKQREIDDLTKDQRTIFVSQLTKKVGERELETFFGQIGRVRNVILLRDKQSGQHKGFAYVEMGELESIPDCLLFNNVVPDFQKFPILVKASEAEKNFLAKRDPFSLKNQPDASELDTRVYVGNIHVSIDENALKLVLDQFGPTESIKIHRDHLGNSKGFAFVKYIRHDSALLAMKGLPGLELVGRPLKAGPVTDHRGQNMPMSVSSNSATVGGNNVYDASGNWKLDADEGSAGMVLNAHSRLALMAKLGQTAGINVPVPPVIPGNVIPPQPAAATTGQIPVGPVSGLPSLYFMISNMFDPATETEPNWHLDIQEDVADECRKHGAVQQVVVERVKPGGMVFISMTDLASTQQAVRALHGRFFAGRTITVTYLDQASFDLLVSSA